MTGDQKEEHRNSGTTKQRESLPLNTNALVFVLSCDRQSDVLKWQYPLRPSGTEEMTHTKFSCQVLPSKKDDDYL